MSTKNLSVSTKKLSLSTKNLSLSTKNLSGRGSFLSLSRSFLSLSSSFPAGGRPFRSGRGSLVARRASSPQIEARSFAVTDCTAGVCPARTTQSSALVRITLRKAPPARNDARNVLRHAAS